MLDHVNGFSDLAESFAAYCVHGASIEGANVLIKVAQGGAGEGLAKVKQLKISLNRRGPKTKTAPKHFLLSFSFFKFFSQEPKEQ